MEKTYKFILPQNKEVEKTNIRIENGEVFVDVEFKEKFEPKDGDFLVLKNSIFIYKANGGTITLNGYYVGVNCDGEIVINDRLNSGFGLRGEKMRYATPEEKAAFLERLEKEYHQRWNSEKKCLEDIYIPKFGDIVKIEHSDITKFKRNYVLSIYPNKEIPTKDENDFFDIVSIGMNGDVRVDDAREAYKNGFVFKASDAEKKELYDRLAEVGKRWNEETKRLENIRWKPNNGDAFYYVDVNGDVRSVTCTGFMNFFEEFPNCFKTPEAAQKVADQIKEIFKNSKAE